MAINVDTVYKTTLLILNKEQRGYVTPDEFNKIATQVQLDVFDQYFEDLNQQLRSFQSEFDYSDRHTSIDEKISPFKTSGVCNFLDAKFLLPQDTEDGLDVVLNEKEDLANNEVVFYKLGVVTYTGPKGLPVEITRLQRGEFYNIQRSPLTTPTPNFPVYLYENNKLMVRPFSVTSGVEASFLRKPKNIEWAYSYGSLGQYIYDQSASTNFELNASEQVNVVLRVLMYFGLVIKNPEIVQAAFSEIQENEMNKKR